MSTAFHSILRAIAAALEIPVVIILVILAAFAVFSVGWLIVEYITEHRRMTVYVPRMLDDLRSGRTTPSGCVEASTLLKRQKEALLEMGRHPDFSIPMRRSLADNLIEAEQFHYDRILKRTDLLAKVSPMMGLLGTLIPLGPGIIALGQGDTATLSASLLTAFDTTIAGLAVAAVYLTISTIRRNWYGRYMSDLETLTDCVLELYAESARDGREEKEASGTESPVKGEVK